MKHPQTYLMEKIIGYKENGMPSLGHLPAKTIDDLVKVMQSFAEETVIEVIDRLNKGERLEVGNKTLKLNTVLS
jgi:hypothetical protein